MAGFAPANGASMGSVFVKRAGDACACFAEVAILEGDYVTRLAERASFKLDWRTSAAYVELFLVPAEIEDALAVGEVGLEAVVLATRPLSSIKALSAVGIRDRSCLLARLNGPSAAAPGECVRERLPVSFRARRGWDSTGFSGRHPRLPFLFPVFSFAHPSDVLKEVRGLAASLEKVTADVKIVLKQQLEAAADDKSYMSPSGREYETLASTKSDSCLRFYCGLVIADDSRRSVADMDPSSGGMQWDARLAVTCARDWAPPPRTAAFVVFGGLDYSRPAPLPAPRNMSPGKPVAAEYLAVLEFTRVDNWYETWRSESGKKTRKGLLGRFEQRLAKCVQRARTVEPRLEVVNTLDLVALVGVVGEFSCQDGVEAQLSKSDCPYPELKRMFEARRFVFFYLPKVRVL